MSTVACASITVTWQPDLPVLLSQLVALRGLAQRIVVDNGSRPEILGPLREACALEGVALVELGRNLGLAAGLNAGARAVLERDASCPWLVFLDQDTEPQAGGVEAMIVVAESLARGHPLGLVGPVMVDAATGLSHGAHVIDGWRWSRVFPGPEFPPVRSAGINGSGMLVGSGTFREHGGFDESLFIDHVDTEYGFRLAAAGLAHYTVPGVRFSHRMGEKTLRFWLAGWRAWPYRSPLRHFYLFRNAVVLMRRSYVPRVWKFWALVKLAMTLGVHACVDPLRVPQVKAMVAGIGAGLRGEQGPADPERFR